MGDFVHLHLHTEYSLLDGACRIGPLLDAVKAKGQSAVAITDHGVMYGAVDFYKAAKERGIKPIIGCEVYVAARSRHDKVHALDGTRNHLILLCKDNIGYQNLIAMVSEAWTSGFYVKPRVDKELLEKYHEGLIALSACLAGEIPQALTRNDYEGAKSTALWYNDVFGQDNFYLELQNHGIHEQLQVNDGLIKLSKETGIPLVATNDTHYVNKEDSRIQQVLICIQTNNTLGENTGFEFETEEFYLKSKEEMSKLFKSVPEAIENTEKIAERCNVEFEFGNTKLPHFEVPDNEEHFEFLKDLCEQGLAERYGEKTKELQERLDYELSTINNMGFTDYFLIVWDFIRYAKSQKIPVGPGRGSGAGSLVAYCIGITGIDPMKYNLLFERFLNPERVSMPDFDVDFCYERRGEVIDYVIEKYGADHVAQIVTFGTMAARGAVRDVGRALGIPYAVVDNVAKQIPTELNITIDSALKKSPGFKELYESSADIKDLIDTAKSVEGMPRHASTHAAGVVITRDPVATYVPLAKNDDAVVTQFTMTTLEELGLLKMDFLGLRTLTVVDDAAKIIKEKNPDFDINEISLEDEEVFKMLARGETDGVFQCESAGMSNLIMNMKPEKFEDIIAVIALYRPGPMYFIPSYIENRHNPEKITYKTPLLKNILDVTYGCMIYQEQVMQIFRELAGYSYGRADIVRRAMSKKKHSVMEKERKNFIYGLINEDGTTECEGAVKRGVDEKTANEIFDEMSSFASYAFNKSHSAVYAYIAYQTAWLKYHYPCEFMAALLTSVLDSSGKVSKYIAECNRLNIEVLPPSVNESVESFTVNENSIRFGLLAIKNLGRGFIRAIIEERTANGKFTSFYSFCKRVYGKDFNRRALESLIKCGALDNLGANRNQMLQTVSQIIDGLEDEKRRNVDGQIGFFEASEELQEASEPQMPSVDELPVNELLSLEKEITGLYLSGHPMSEYRDLAKRIGSAKTTDLTDAISDAGSMYKDGTQIKLLGIIAHIKKKTTKNDAVMAFVDIEDMYGSIEVIVFPRTLLDNVRYLNVGEIVLLRGRLSIREDEEPKIVCERIEPCPKEDSPELKRVTAVSEEHSKKKKPGLFLRFKSKDSEDIKKAEKLLCIFDGSTPLYYYYLDEKKYEPQKPDKWVDVNETLLKELKTLLGEENAIYQ